jgi:DNA polymerase-1
MEERIKGKSRYVLIDGHSLAYRAFYALPKDLATSSGQMTNAVYGFTSMLIKLLEELRPQAVIAAFDKGKPEFRLKKFAEYKAHRKPMPDELREQIDIIHGVLEALNIPCLEEEGYEADDILATLVERLPTDAEVFIVTGDRDALQLVDDRVKVVANRKGITDIIIYDPQKVEEKYGVAPGQIVDYLALKGDASDNIPGVPGIGEKTASALIQEFGGLDEVYENLDKVKGARWRKALEENRESADMSRELARMRSDVPLGIEGIPGIELEPWEQEGIERIFASLEFKKLHERLLATGPLLFAEYAGEMAKGESLKPAREIAIKGDKELQDLSKACKECGEIALYAHIDGEGFSRGEMSSIAAAVGENTYHIDLNDGRGKELACALLEMLEADRDLRVLGYQAKEMMVQCAKICERYPGFDFDVELASYLINPSGVKHDLESAMTQFLGTILEESKEGQLDLLESEEKRATGDMRRALGVIRLVEPMQAEINLKEVRSLYEEVEIPLQGVLADMEIKGVRLDATILGAMEKEMEEEIEELEEGVYDLAGEHFNLNSPQQLSHILFEVLDLPPVKKTKTGYATDVSVLNALRELHPIADLLLRYRELSKLKSTYISALPRLVDTDTGRLHASFNQAVTATGRLSSSNPNLQNIPVRTPLGRKIRKAFIPTSEGGVILAADYSQIELRVMAHLSEDPGLMRAFEEDLDIHTSTASEVFDVSLDEVTPEQRNRAKAINFGIIYGISPYGLAVQLGIEQEEAETYIRNYFRRYPQVRAFLDKQVEEASRNGYVVTLLGRRREIPELAAGNVRMRKFGERLAFNTPIQGSAADIIKLAMLRIHRGLDEGGFASGMILQVHDELVFDVEPGEQEGVEEAVRKEMEGALELEVPLKVDIGMGSSWYEAK